MITVKSIVRSAMLLVIALLLVSCEAESSSEIPLEPLGKPQETLPPNAYYVTVASDCSAERREMAESLAAAIRVQTGVSAEALYAHETPPVTKGAITVYLGWIADQESVSGRMRTFRRDDYLCCRVGDEMILGGRTDEATRTAMDRFCREILPAATAQSLMSENGGFLYCAEGLGTVKLNGFALWEYRIVYPAEGARALRDLACELRDEIVRRSGYVLEVVPDDAFDSADKGIFVGTQTPAQEGECAYLIPVENGVLLSAGDFFGVSVAAERLCAHLLTGTEAEDRAWSLSASASFGYSHRSYDLFSMAREERGALPTPDGITELLDPILLSRPDGVMLGEVGDAWSVYLTQNMSGYTPMDRAEGDRIYGKGELLRFTGAYASVAEGLTVNSFWVGDEWSGFRVLRVFGNLREDAALSWTELSSVLDNTPTVILIHTAGGAAMPTGTMPQDVCAVFSEQMSAQTERGFFACYTAGADLMVNVSNGGSSVAYRSVTVERISAF